MIIIVASYAHEIGHYLVMKYYYPNAGSIRFVWDRIFLIPVPRKVISKDLNGDITIIRALVAFFSGPIAGLIVITVLSYLLLDAYLFIVPLSLGLHSSKGDFEKIYITAKEGLEEKKSNQET
ncbi:MAG: hypothetical protein KAQ64_00080 [Candidatus Pacebacteria bacterium]|nr:hypothetical protein [Candidatus Paceibacterota bacterium]